jgi:hypothetical protein
VLWMMLELMKLKATSGWSDTSFLALLELLSKVLPKPNGLPSSTYQEDHLSIDFGYRKNPCLPEPLHLIPKRTRIQIWCNASQHKRNGNSEEVEDDSNTTCKKKRGQKRKNVTPDQDIKGSKERKIPALVMWYLSVIDRLKHMF